MSGYLQTATQFQGSSQGNGKAKTSDSRGGVVDLTESLSEASSESDDEPQVTEVRQGIAPKVGTKRNLPWMDEQLMQQQHMQHQQQRQRIEPGTYVSESYQPGSYGQEISYSLLNRGEVEVKWTGDGAPSQPFVQEFNRLLNLYASNKYEGKPRMRALAKNSFAILVSDYRNFRNALWNAIKIPTLDVPEMAIQAVTMGSSDASEKQSLPQDELDWLCSKLPHMLFQTLAPFQKVGVFWGASTKNGRCLIADEPGLGKTIQSIGIAAAYQHEWPLLVITPSSARYHWETELLKWLEDEHGNKVLQPNEVQVMLGGAKPINPSMRALVVSYDLVDRVKEQLMQVNGGQGFKVVIADECHMLKNQNTKRAKAILPMLRNATRSILLSGTPALSRPKELWSQLNVIDSNAWPSYSKFCKRYCCTDKKKEEQGGAAEDEGYKRNASNVMELHALLRENCMIRRHKSDILKGLPPKTRSHVQCEIEDNSVKNKLAHDLYTFVERQSGDSVRTFSQAKDSKKKLSELQKISAQVSMQLQQQQQLQEEQKKMQLQQLHLMQMQQATMRGLPLPPPPTMADLPQSSADLNAASSSSSSSSDPSLSNRELAQQRKNLLMKLFKDTGVAKLPAIKRHVQGLLDDPTAPKFLVFAHHHNVLDALENSVFKGVHTVRIDGRTNPKERQARINRFQNDPTIRAAVLGITAAGVAITLTAASRAVFTELFWTPAALLQAEDRCHRIGQTAHVTIEYLVAKNSVDDLLWPLLQEKMKLLGEVVEGVQGSSMALTNGTDNVRQLAQELAEEDSDRPKDVEAEERGPLDDEFDDILVVGSSQKAPERIENVAFTNMGVPVWQPYPPQLGYGRGLSAAPRSMMLPLSRSSSASAVDDEVECLGTSSMMDGGGQGGMGMGMGGQPAGKFDMSAAMDQKLRRDLGCKGGLMMGGGGGGGGGGAGGGGAKPAAQAASGNPFGGAAAARGAQTGQARSMFGFVSRANSAPTSSSTFSLGPSSSSASSASSNRPNLFGLSRTSSLGAVPSSQTSLSLGLQQQQQQQQQHQHQQTFAMQQGMQEAMARVQAEKVQEEQQASNAQLPPPPPPPMQGSMPIQAAMQALQQGQGQAQTHPEPVPVPDDGESDDNLSAFDGDIFGDDIEGVGDEDLAL